MKKQTKLMLGDNIESLRKLPDNSIDSCVTDGPYGLSFMNKKWDYDVPSVEFWKEVYRVLKPGGHILSFGGTRTYHRMVVNIEDAGFEIRDQIQWLYASGFPKSHNIGKAVDKLEGNEREVVGEVKRHDFKDPQYIEQGSMMKTDNSLMINLPITKGTSQYEGWGTALKPANEPICVARKPLSEKSVAENVLKWRTGGINIDGCRIGTEGGTRKENIKDAIEPNAYGGGKGIGYGDVIDTGEGRFPANIILECLCDEVIKGEKVEVKMGDRDSFLNSNNVFAIKNDGKAKRIENYGDKGDIHTNPMCPCRLMDEQSGFSKTNCKKGEVDMSKRTTQGAVFVDVNGKPTSGHKKIINASTINDKGGASRFFYQAKVSKKERNMGLDHFEEVDESKNKAFDVEGGRRSKYDLSIKKNNHPTVKPVSLMAYLCRLITPPNGIILDPFMGSGSTGIAARLEGFRFCGMEMDKDYFKIAEARIENYEKYREFLK